MLVLGRTKFQSVLVGDEITVTVEEICDIGDGRRIFGASVQLGFQTPPYVPICRSELRSRRPGSARVCEGAPRTRPRRGEIVDLPGAQVRLRIQAPRKVPVRHNGMPTVALDSHGTSRDEKGNSMAVHRVTCHKNDRIAICNNIIIATLGFRRSVSGEQDPSTGEAIAARGGATVQDIEQPLGAR